MNGLQLYTRYIGISIRGQMEYRFSFLMQSVAHFLITVTEFAAIWSLFLRFDNIQGWSFHEIAVFYGMISIAFAISDSLSRGFDLLDRLIRSGDFDRYLLRPRSSLLQILGHEFTLKRIGRLSQGIAVLYFGAAHLQLSWTPAKILLLFWTLLGAVALFTGLRIMQATIAFWTVESLEIMNVLTYGGIETAQFPMTIYLPWFRKFFTFVVPLACVNYFPLLLILQKPDPLGTSVLFQALAPLAGLIFLGIAILGWQFGLRYYSSTGS